jgi:MFS family permease
MGSRWSSVEQAQGLHRIRAHSGAGVHCALALEPVAQRALPQPLIATIVANVGTWMQDVGSGWLMTSLSSSPSMVALVEAADSLPVMLLALPAGAIADIVDKRRLLIAVQIYLMIVVGALGVLTLFDLTTAWGLLGFTFAMGVGAALLMPAWSAIVRILVPPEELRGGRVEQRRRQCVTNDRPGIAGVLVAAVGRGLSSSSTRFPTSGSSRYFCTGDASTARAHCPPSGS